MKSLQHFLRLLPLAILGLAACDQVVKPMTLETGLYEVEHRLIMTELVAYGDVIVPKTDEVGTYKFCISDPKLLMGVEIISWTDTAVGNDCDVERKRADGLTLSYKKVCRFDSFTRTSIDTVSIGEDRTSWAYTVDGKLQTESGDVEVDIIATAHRTESC